MIRASSMGRIMLCGASHNMQKNYPNISNESAQEGSLAHEWASKILTVVASSDDIEDIEMRGHIAEYVNFCKKIRADTHTINGVEETYNDGHMSGCTDFFCWTPYELIITDLKYGFGWVEVEENWQLICYAILMWLKYGNNGAVIPPKVRLIIYQPRADHPDGPDRDWDFPGEQLRGYYNQIQNRISEIEAGTATAVPGKHCRYCQGIVDCKANREYICGPIVGRGYVPEKQSITPVELSKELDLINEASELIRHRLMALEARVEEVIKSGEIVPGYVFQQKISPLSWDVPDPITAAADLGIDIQKPPQPITPTQAVNRGLISNEMIKFMASRKAGGFALKRQNMSAVKRIMEGTLK
jgi:hypothetical protein